MGTFEDLNLTKFLHNAIEDLGYTTPTPIQEEAFPVILSGKDIVGIAQTGTGKTFAYLLPLLRELKFSKQQAPRILILVPTRELVVQVVEAIEKLTAYMNVRIAGVYGGVNMNTHIALVQEGQDIIVATPGRLYDLAISRMLSLKSIQKLVIDEVDVMLDLGFRFQLMNIFDLLPERRQNIMFSATMTTEVDDLITDFFMFPEKISVAASGTPLENIEQTRYEVPNFYTKINLIADLLKDKQTFSKVVIFSPDKKKADILFEKLEDIFMGQCAIIHSNKTQNYRLRAIEDFDNAKKRILVASDIIARGLDFEELSHVISIDVPEYPENYIHRIGRTGRAEKEGKSILLSTPKEVEYVEAIEDLMQKKINFIETPEYIEINEQLLPEERTKVRERNNPIRVDEEERGPAFHEKKEKNKKVNQGGSYRRELAKKYKKPKTRGDKNANKKKRRR
ncbi:DEAD/DEAH box helicase [Neptunitalea lumnitzerae]|uniref:DEAD/DEAH box helicase n=1 Tax=Neptunitalea lumnitzerae TaxID=2965509 RepID=A0ABQ5MKA0_9FLAO|nr:DEAD/DEAH box helicase [Neptunitalea sp. Y10]GLB49809.1 DEAD/DEAH box helicase [Neptunitalea sp. Y10]